MATEKKVDKEKEARKARIKESLEQAEATLEDEEVPIAERTANALYVYLATDDVSPAKVWRDHVIPLLMEHAVQNGLEVTW